MRRRASCSLQVALLTTSLLLPVGLPGQHVGIAAPMPSGHMGAAAHPTPSFSGASRSFASPAGPQFQGARHPSSPTARSGHWPSWDPGRHPDNGRRGVGYRGPGFYVGYPWLAPFGYGLPFATPYGDDQDEGGGAPVAPQQADYSNQPPGDYGPEAPEVAANTPSPFRPTYEGQIEFAPVHLQPTTTLIFKDGRTPVQVHNYALTANTLYALDGDSRQEIPLSVLDVPATVEANRKAGVDFALPVSH
jgi:hypothetical protein